MTDEDSAPAASEPRTRIDRLLGVFSDVRGGESIGALLLLVNLLIVVVWIGVGILLYRRYLVLAG